MKLNREKFEVRPYIKSDAYPLTCLFHGAVHAISDDLYTVEQKEAWAPSPPNHRAWKIRLDEKSPYVATLDGTAIGFIELEADGHIDCLYVDMGYQGMGVGSELLMHALKSANQRRMTHLYTEASKVARPIFERFGFVYRNTNHIQLRGQSLVNYTMILNLDKLAATEGNFVET